MRSFTPDSGYGISKEMPTSEGANSRALGSSVTGGGAIPACGFSARTVQALRTVDADFAAMNILPDPRIREVLSQRSEWPTIPQLFVDGEFVGGADITLELFESGELAELVKIPTAS